MWVSSTAFEPIGCSCVDPIGRKIKLVLFMFGEWCEALEQFFCLWPWALSLREMIVLWCSLLNAELKKPTISKCLKKFSIRLSGSCKVSFGFNEA